MRAMSQKEMNITGSSTLEGDVLPFLFVASVSLIQFD